MPFDAMSDTVAVDTVADNHKSLWSAVLNFLHPLPTKESDLFRKKMTPRDVLIAAKLLIIHPSQWTQGDYVDAFKRRCAMGAIGEVINYGKFPLLHNQAVHPLIHIANQRGFHSVGVMNDLSTHAQVMSAFDEAIQSFG